MTLARSLRIGGTHKGSLRILAVDPPWEAEKGPFFPQVGDRPDLNHLDDLGITGVGL